MPVGHGLAGDGPLCSSRPIAMKTNRTATFTITINELKFADSLMPMIKNHGDHRDSQECDEIELRHDACGKVVTSTWATACTFCKLRSQAFPSDCCNNKFVPGHASRPINPGTASAGLM